MLLLEDARRGMEYIAAVCTEDADAALARLQKSCAGVAEHPYAAELAASLQRD